MTDMLNSVCEEIKKHRDGDNKTEIKVAPVCNAKLIMCE